MSVAIFCANLPTLVPPNFCTSHGTPGSVLFRSSFGGVRRPLVLEDGEDTDAVRESGGLEAVRAIVGR
jgi:hypothetical protein